MFAGIIRYFLGRCAFLRFVLNNVDCEQVGETFFTVAHSGRLKP